MPAQSGKKWRIHRPNEAEADRLARRLNIQRITAKVLLNRGLGEEALARPFLNPNLNLLHDPAAMPGMEEAARRVRRAIEQREKIVIYGDYDVDGISAIAILLKCMSLLGAQASYYVPDRLEEGYGLNSAAIRKLAREGTQLLITVDCGIGGAAEVALARELGMNVIVTDHHEPGSVLPSGAVLVNPKLPDSRYPFRDISGAGLAFKLAWSIGRTYSSGGKVAADFKQFLLEVISLAALGTIADVVPLRDENRVIAHFGLRGLSDSSAPGICALREAAGVQDAEITAYDVAFKLAPRLNAAGRLGSARHAVEMLTTDSTQRALEIAAHLNRENARRQRLQERIISEAQEMIERAGGVEGRCSIVLASEDWHAGVIGIAAARLVEKYLRPTVLLAVEGDLGHGSARSFGPVHLFESLAECSSHLIGFGGHAHAAGLRIRASEIEPFSRDFERAAARRLRPEDLTAFLDIDVAVNLEEVNRPLVDELMRLAPFGEGNEEPLLAAENVVVQSEINRMGTSGKHLAFWVKQGKAAFRAVAFGQGDLAAPLQESRACSIAFVPTISRWGAETTIELDVRDIKIQ